MVIHRKMNIQINIPVSSVGCRKETLGLTHRRFSGPAEPAEKAALANRFVKMLRFCSPYLKYGSQNPHILPRAWLNA